ncbi:MAG: CcdB family protein [Novosphingobium sp.]
MIDYQADLLSSLTTMLVIPLRLLDEAANSVSRLMSIFEIQGEKVVIVTQFAAAVSVREMGYAVHSVVAERTCSSK